MFYRLQELIDQAIIFYADSLLVPFLELSRVSTFAVITVFLTFILATFRTSRLLAGKTVIWARLIRYFIGHIWFALGVAFIFWFVLMFALAHASSADWNPEFWNFVFNSIGERARLFLSASIFGLLLGGTTWIWIGRKMEPRLQQFVDRRINGAHQGYIDVRQIKNHLPANQNFAPESFFPKSKKSNALFLGLDEAKKPVTIPRTQYITSNVQLVAPPGRGKGVCAGVVVSGHFILDHWTL